MTEMLEKIAPPALGAHDATCPFCAGTKLFQLKGYHTKRGDQKDERALDRNLKASGELTSDSDVGTVYPLPGGGEPHRGWQCAPEVLEEIAVEVRPTPHHLIPGNDAMAKSTLEDWTCASKGKIKEDIGYSIDCAQNGIWLPHLPHIHWTRMMDKAKKLRFSDVFGTWGDLPASRQETIGYFIMGETWLQMHYTDHDDPYEHVDDDENYNDEAKDRCNQLGDLMTAFWGPHCPESNDESDGKYFPPYGLVQRINAQSNYMRKRITGRPTFWRSWVSPIAQDYSEDLKQDRVRLTTTFAISKL
jgi:hypothetical protein